MAEREAMAKQEVRGVRQLEVPRRRFCGRRELGSIRGHSLVTAPAGGGAAMAATRAAGLEGRGRNVGTAQGQKANLSQRVQELRAVIALQEQGRKFFTQSCEEKLSQNRELLPRLREAVQEDVHALGIVQKHNKLTTSEACGAQQHLGITLARKTVEVAQEKLRADIFRRVNTCNMLLYQMRQRSRAQDELQTRLQQLQDAEMDDQWHQAQLQVIRQLENSTEKMLMKVHAGQKVTALYLAVRDVLRKELAHLPPHLDLLCGMAKLYHGELEDMELMALDALKAADVTKEDMAEMETQFLAEREFRYRSLATQKVHIDRHWLKEASERHLRVQAGYELAMDFPTMHPQDPLVGADLEATKSQKEHEAWVTEKMEKAKTAVQCSHLWDIPGRLLAQQKSSADLEQYVKECKEKKQLLKETLKELELKQAELKFRQPPNKTSCMDVNVVGSRMLEEELRMNLQWEEARLEQMRAQMLRNQELLLEFENGIDNLLVHLHGITVPGQDDSVKARGVEEKLQHCGQKLQYLVERVAVLPPHKHSPDEDNETFVKVRNFLEKTTANDPQNLKISLEDIGSGIQDPFDFADKDNALVLTREDIKKQGLHLIESKKKSGKKK
ncbi:PREDICTED: coiled-coil domain-containing protein 183 [Aptenodytes forsteri]|uniref:coiled-coil domain-containing protein 183 n=1 Tax=Aptenodytes forsteri TaxID=9233 RepID=UPI0004F4B0DF|nr:PREDICTED: coiled-coil domain-containing protein 183 [Aptenodytes forsteri]